MLFFKRRDTHGLGNGLVDQVLLLGVAGGLARCEIDAKFGAIGARHDSLITLYAQLPGGLVALIVLLEGNTYCSGHIFGDGYIRFSVCTYNQLDGVVPQRGLVVNQVHCPQLKSPLGQEQDQSTMSQEYRLKLRASIKILLWIALCFVVYVFAKGMFSGPGGTKAVPTQVVEVGHWQPGDTQLLNWAGRPVVIHRRTEEEIVALENSDANLVLPELDVDLQNTRANSSTRSVTPEWFIAIALGADLVCVVEYLPPSAELFLDRPWPGGYKDTCDGSRFDGAGRSYRDQSATKPMIIPQYAIKDSRIILGAQ